MLVSGILLGVRRRGRRRAQRALRRNLPVRGHELAAKARVRDEVEARLAPLLALLAQQARREVRPVPVVQDVVDVLQQRLEPLVLGDVLEDDRAEVGDAPHGGHPREEDRQAPPCTLDVARTVEDAKDDLLLADLPDDHLHEVRLVVGVLGAASSDVRRGVLDLLDDGGKVREQDHDGEERVVQDGRTISGDGTRRDARTGVDFAHAVLDALALGGHELVRDSVLVAVLVADGEKLRGVEELAVGGHAHDGQGQAQLDDELGQQDLELRVARPLDGNVDAGLQAVL